jgi:hypothetical protein
VFGFVTFGFFLFFKCLAVDHAITQRQNCLHTRCLSDCQNTIQSCDIVKLGPACHRCMGRYFGNVATSDRVLAPELRSNVMLW